MSRNFIGTACLATAFVLIGTIAGGSRCNGRLAIGPQVAFGQPAPQHPSGQLR